MPDVSEELDDLAETLELALEPLEAMQRVQRENTRPTREWWIDRRQTAQDFLERAVSLVAGLQLLCDFRPVQNSAPMPEAQQ